MLKGMKISKKNFPPKSPKYAKCAKYVNKTPKYASRSFADFEQL